MRRYLPYCLGLLIASLLIGGPLAFGLYYKANYRLFRVVREGVLYRSGQLSSPALRRAVHEYGFRTIISLRDGSHPGEPPPDSAEENYCAAHGIRFLRIPSGKDYWEWNNGTAPAIEGVKQFRAIMDEPRNYPVLVHCWGGIHRSGAYCAVYRMEYQGWTNDEAIEELRRLGYKNLDDEWDILGFLQHFRPRRTWPE